MKYFISAMLVVLFSCGKKSETLETPTGFSVKVTQNQKLSGSIFEKDVPSFITVWKADSRDFDLSKIDEGHIFDRSASAYIKYDYASRNTLHRETKEGKYLVFVQLGDVGYGSFSTSYKYFDVQKGKFTFLKKVFTTHATTGSFEAWDKEQ